MHFDGRIQAVIELAALKSLSELEIDFLRLIKERVSINLNASVARFRNEELLDKSLEQAKELKARDQELMQKLEEIQIPPGYERELIIIGNHAYSIVEKVQNFLGER